MNGAKRAVWNANRLRGMSGAEIGLRAWRAAAQAAESRRLARGWSPGARVRLERHRPLFGRGDDVVAAWRRRFRVDAAGIESLLNGDVHFFGRTFPVGPLPDWHRDPETGRIAPLTFGKRIDYRDETVVGNIKTLWELGRHQHLVPLAAAYAVTGDGRCKSAVIRQIEGWIDANPYGLGVHWCSALEVALRAIAWCMVDGLLTLRDGAGGLLGAALRPDRLLCALYQHGYFIRGLLSRHSSANNHLIGELVGLWCLARVFDFGAPSSEWSSRAKRELEEQAQRQVHGDGVAREQAVHYQLELMDYLLFAWCVGRASGMELDAVVLERLSRMTEFLRDLTPPGGAPPQIGDSDEGTVNRFTAGCTVCAHDEVADAVLQVLSERHAGRYEKGFWYRCIANGQSGTAADDLITLRAPHQIGAADAEPLPLDCRWRVRVFPEGGYSVLRQGALHVVFDAGPLGYPSIAAHGHADALALCLARNSRWWLVDPGTYAYHGEPAFRNYFRGTAAHNTVTVDDRDQSGSGGPFLWVRHARAHLLGAGEGEGGVLWTEGLHDGYRRLGLRHRRRIECGPGERIRVVDVLEGSPRKPVTVALHFHFAPAVELTLTGNRCAGRMAGEPDLEMDLDGRCAWRLFRGSADPIRGWYSAGLGRKEPCFTLQGTVMAAGPVEIVSSFAFAAPVAPTSRLRGVTVDGRA